MPFQKGQSGNPAGRPAGARGKSMILADEMFAGEAEDIIRAAIDLAKGGDTSAMRLCLDRIAPRPRERTVSFALPPLNSAADAAAAVAAVIEAVGAGEVAPAEASALLKLVDAFLRTLEMTSFEERIARLERKRAASELEPWPASEAEGLHQARPMDEAAE
jgi:hypothetical protein